MRSGVEKLSERRIHVPIVLAVLALAGTVWGEVLIDSDFGDSAKLVLARNGKPSPTFKGVMPDGWTEDSSGWAKVWAACTVHGEEGMKFLRINVTKIESGRPQFCFEPLPDIKDIAYFRLKLKLRNRSGSMIQFGVRMRGHPYEMYWEKQGKFSSKIRGQPPIFR